MSEIEELKATINDLDAETREAQDLAELNRSIEQARKALALANRLGEERDAAIAENKSLKTRCADTLKWMIADLDFRKSQTGLDIADSPEMEEARALYAELTR